MQSYIIAGMCAALLSLATLWQCARDELFEAKAALAAAEKVNEANREAVRRLELSMQATDRALAGWNEDRTTLAAVRGAARQAIREAMQDENFKVWASSPAPGAAWRLLNEAADANGNGGSVSANGPFGGLPGNAASRQRQQWGSVGGGQDAAP
jgi:hypothetical protein